MRTCLQAALAYATRGWPVFPLHGIVTTRCTCGRKDCSSPGKHPLVRRGLHDATTDLEQIRSWWTSWPRANVAIETGTRSGLVVIDIDLGHRTDTAFGSPGGSHQAAMTAWESLDRVFGKLPVTLTGLTGGGGVHLIYRRGREPLRSSCGRVPGIEGELPGIDVRADSGYIGAPPSAHVSGEHYCWLDRPIAAAPAWLKDTERHKPMVIPPAGVFDGHGTAHGRAVLNKALASIRCAPVGQRNNTLNRWAFISVALLPQATSRRCQHALSSGKQRFRSASPPGKPLTPSTPHSRLRVGAGTPCSPPT